MGHENMATNYTFTYVRSPWIVGYHPEHDEVFMYFIDQNDLCWVFRRGGIDVVGFFEFMDFSKAEILGEL